MTISPEELVAKANEQALYCLYIRLAHHATPADGDTLRTIVEGLDAAYRAAQPRPWKERSVLRLDILKSGLAAFPAVGRSVIGDLTRSRDGLTACSFTNVRGELSVVFRGTGKGEWIDNGEGLSGIPEENTYLVYGKGGRVLLRRTVREDYATDQQVEALNWFRRIAAEHGWHDRGSITLSGHSKGGNKAQFVAAHSDLVRECYSFDGQGFSPEALAALQKRHGPRLEARRRRIFSLSADNDYVNVLGQRLMPPQNVYYLGSDHGFHYLEALFDAAGRLHPLCEQGELSRFVEGVSHKLMALPPAIRQHAALGVMNLFQKYLGRGTPVNGDAVSVQQTVAGLGISIALLLGQVGERTVKSE